jgi:hypothetical protein
MNMIRLLASGDPSKFAYYRDVARFDQMAELLMQVVLR